MDEIRFNPPLPPKPKIQKMETGDVSGIRENDSGFFKKRTKVFAFIFLALLLVAGGLFAGGSIANVWRGLRGGGAADVYSAVFLSNGQVYFGKITSKNSSELVLSSVFYLQSDSAPNIGMAASNLKLAKLGNEIHGPTDELRINASQVLFYENLREDSRVVQLIKNYKE